MRKRIRKILVTILVVVFCVAGISNIRFFLSLDKKDPLHISSRRVKGSPNAPIKIVEYIDFRCGPCAYGSRWLKGFMQKHPGKIFLEVRSFPLHLSRGALAARFTECALKQKKFWEAHDALMENQAKWIRLPNAEKFFLEVAKKENMDIKALEACWKDPELYDEIMIIKSERKNLGVKATPTYFINGKMLVGAQKMSAGVASILGIALKDQKITPGK